MVVGEMVADKIAKRVAKKVAKKRVAEVAETWNRTFPSVTSVRNLGNSPRVPGGHFVAGGRRSHPGSHDEVGTRPTQRCIMELLSMAVDPEERRAFRQRFERAHEDESGACCDFLCRTPISVLSKAFECELLQLCSAADMFPESGLQSEFLNEFYVMDVILNRAPSPAASTGVGGAAGGGGADCDVVRHVLSCDPEDDDPPMDYKYRAAILFLPQCGVFYCHHRDRHLGDAGVPGTLRAYDMSWLRLRREALEDGHLVSYSFGGDGFVRRFYSEVKGKFELIDAPRFREFRGRGGRDRVSAWRISTGYRHCSLQNRVVYRAAQCRDAELPKLPPDFIYGTDYRSVLTNYRAHEFRNQLKTSASTKLDCRHYHLPASCWIIDPDKTTTVDVHIGEDGIPDGETVVMIRNVTKIDAHDDNQELLKRLTSWCREIRMSGAKGSARAKSSDPGCMFPLGTRVQTGESPVGAPVHNTIPYATNGRVADDVLRGLVVDLANLGRRCFPQVYSVIRDTKGNSGLSPVSPMDGMALPVEMDGDGTPPMGADEDGADDNNGNNNADDAEANDNFRNQLREKLRKKLRKEMEMLEHRRRVGYTIDMSINLGNSSHFDVNNASQAFSVWLEEIVGHGENWYFVLPNVYGVRLEQGKRIGFQGMAVKLGHGVAISWDGRKIRHCMTASCPDGMKAGYVAKGNESSFRNHLYGVFTAAKEKIVKAGRARCAASNRPRVHSFSVDEEKSCKSGKRGRKRPKKPRKRPPKEAVLVVGEQATMLPAAVLPVNVFDLMHRANKRRADSEVDVSERQFRSHKRVADKRPFRSDECNYVAHCNLHLQLADLDVGGRHKIPRKQKNKLELILLALLCRQLARETDYPLLLVFRGAPVCV
jgi:hypothetical protein